MSILAKKAGEAMNNVPTVKHVSFFESIKLRDKVAPIQKMITVPIVHDGTAVGVAQISRKGENPVEAGPDFTQADVKRAEQLFAAVAPYPGRGTAGQVLGLGPRARSARPWHLRSGMLAERRLSNERARGRRDRRVRDGLCALRRTPLSA